MLEISKDQVVYSFDKNHPAAATAQDGDTVLFHLKDCFSDEVQSENDVVTELDWNHINPITGPLFVEGAKEGDVLKVTIEKIELNDQASVMAIAGDDNVPFSKNIEENQIVIVDVDDQAGTYNFQGVDFEMNKHIGVIGTAPAGEGVTTGTPGMHGGNMDNRYVAEGSILYLPVHTDGALLGLGDMHADMGDGEVWASGVEVGGKVTLKVEVLKDSNMPTPFVETADAVYGFGAAETAEEAMVLANDSLIQYIQNETDLSYNQAGMLMSMRAHVEVCQIVNPDLSFRTAIKKEDIEKAKNFQA